MLHPRGITTAAAFAVLPSLLSAPQLCWHDDGLGCVWRSASFQAQNAKQQGEVIEVVNGSHEGQLPCIPWRVPERKVQQEAPPQHRFRVTEEVEGELAVVLSKPTPTHSSEWQFVARELQGDGEKDRERCHGEMKIRLQREREYLDHGVVESKAPGRCFSCDQALELLVLGKRVDDEGFRPGPYELDAVLDLLQLENRGQRQNLRHERCCIEKRRDADGDGSSAHGDDGKQRAKYFFVHDVGIQWGVEQYRRLDEPAETQVIPRCIEAE
ncbi:hypothetical protein B296_00040802 [Ensete ventricosum]|uniref:Uncharacterized protein n=1 Tax=Ensete ventricosum TaxID=4639 RepID=A0A426Y9K1_ENSVE|nr:hypothetical protein B296_00040802 [Ensete ventricosum]